MTRPVAAILLAVALAMPARGVDLTLSAAGEADYDSNAFRQRGAEEDDGLFRLRPGVRIHEDRGDDLDFSLEYELPVTFAVVHSELDDIDQLARGGFSYRVGDRTQLTGSERFSYLRGNLQRRVSNEDVAGGGGVPVVSDERERSRRNDASLGLSYNLSPRWLGSAQVAHGYVDSSFEERSTVNTLTGATNVLYQLSPRHRLGGGARFTFQDFGDREGFDGSRSYIYGVFGQWTYVIGPTASFDVSVGPSLIQSEPKNDAQGNSDSQWQLFANALLRKSWTPTLASVVRYDRREGNASGVGGTVVTESASLAVTWDPLERWQFSLRGAWARRDSVTSEFRPSGTLASEVIDTTRWSATGRIDHRFFRNTRVYLAVTYDQQESQGGTAGSSSDFDGFLATLGVRHEFEPIKLW